MRVGIEVVRHYDEKLPRVQSDPLLLHQVFLNMVMNAEHAIAATGKRGRIEITTSVARLGRPHRRDGARHRRRAFPRTRCRASSSRSTRRRKSGRGPASGLAITYGIVQEHGGQIIAANHPEGGAMFTVELPIAPSPRTLNA